MFTFVTGGLRSGKSEYALRRASEHGPPPWLYVAAHIDGDDELKARLANHRRDHDTTWKLIEAPEKLITALDPVTRETTAKFAVALVEVAPVKPLFAITETVYWPSCIGVQVKAAPALKSRTIRACPPADATLNW